MRATARQAHSPWRAEAQSAKAARLGMAAGANSVIVDRMAKFTAVLAVCVAFTACSSPGSTPDSDTTPGPTPAVQRTSIGELPDIDVDAVLAHTKVLASD